jgi:hypothetical protein
MISSPSIAHRKGSVARQTVDWEMIKFSKILPRKISLSNEPSLPLWICVGISVRCTTDALAQFRRQRSQLDVG